MNGLDLIQSPPVSAKVFAYAQAALEQNYGVSYSPEKMMILFEMIEDAGWSEARFRETLKWFIRNHKFPSWTVADWFNHGVRLYPESWYHKQCSETYNPLPHLDRYRLADGTVVYKHKDGIEVPGLEKL